MRHSLRVAGDGVVLGAIVGDGRSGVGVGVGSDETVAVELTCVVGTVVVAEFVDLLVEPHEQRADAERTATVATTTRTTGSPSRSGSLQEKATPIGAVCVAVVVSAIEHQQKSSKKHNHSACFAGRFASDLRLRFRSRRRTIRSYNGAARQDSAQLGDESCAADASEYQNLPGSGPSELEERG